jgi:hypothetical protein
MVLDTVADYVARTRTLLQDLVEPYRYADADLVEFLNEGILVSRHLRPDLWLSTFRGPLPTYDIAEPTTQVAIDPMVRMAFVYYIAGSAQLADQEDTNDERASAFLSKFNAFLTGTVGG